MRERIDQAANDDFQAMLYSTGYVAELDNIEYEVVQPVPSGFTEAPRDDPIFNCFLFDLVHSPPNSSRTVCFFWTSKVASIFF